MHQQQTLLATDWPIVGPKHMRIERQGTDLTMTYITRACFCLQSSRSGVRSSNVRAASFSV